MAINLEQLRKQAKERARVEGTKLSSAQFALAREHGHSSWPALVAASKLEQASFDERVDLFVRFATNDRADRAAAVLDAEPRVATVVWPALVLGDAERVHRYVDADFVRTAAGPNGWLPLLYVTHSAFLGSDRTDGLLQTARLLLDAGADADAFFTNEFGRMSALYGAAGRAHEPRMTTLLLEAGANPNDGESVYHAAEADDVACLRIVLEHGADPNGTVGLINIMGKPIELEGVRLLLDHGADPHEAPLRNRQTALHAAAANGRPETIRLLVEHGANLEARDAQGLTPYALGMRAGRVEAAKALAELGAETATNSVDQLLGALNRGEIDTARELLAGEPTLLDSIVGSKGIVFCEAAYRGDADAVAAMLDLGFDVGLRGDWDATALHWASWRGWPRVAELLLERGADPTEQAGAPTHSQPLDWAAHGSRNAPDEGGDHVAVAELLVAAGAEVTPNELEDASDELRAWLEERLPN